MPTILDELIVQLRLDPSGFSEGQRAALNEFEKLKSTARTTAQSLGSTTSTSVGGFLSAIHKELQDVDLAILALASNSRRTGDQVKAGAREGADGLRSMADAAVIAAGAVATAYGTIKDMTAATGSAAQTVRSSWMAGLDPRWLSAFQQYAYQTGNVPFETTQQSLVSFEQKRQAYKAQGQYPQEFTQLAFFLGMSPAEAANLPLPELMRRISARMVQEGTNGPLAQLIASQTAFGPLAYVLGLGPQAMQAGVQRHLNIGLDDDQLNRLNRFNQAINDLENSWTNMSGAIIASHPEWEQMIKSFQDFEIWITKDKDAANALGTVFEIVFGATMIKALEKFSIALLGIDVAIAKFVGRAALLGWVLSSLGMFTPPIPHQRQDDEDKRLQNVPASKGPYGPVRWWNPFDWMTGHGAPLNPQTRSQSQPIEKPSTRSELSPSDFDRISQAEGTWTQQGINWDMVSSGATAPGLSGMSLSEVIAFAASLPRGHEDVGGLQLNRGSIIDAMRGLGLDPSTKFTPETQKKIANWIYQRQGIDAWHGFRAHPELRPQSQAPQAQARGVNPLLNAAMQAAAGQLPPGYTARMTSGVRTGNPSSQHFSGNAEDWQIYDPQGRPIVNRGSDTTGLYQQMAINALKWLMVHDPEAARRFAWGGHFGTEIGGGGPPDLMHYDLGGARGHYGDPNVERQIAMGQIARSGQLAQVSNDNSRTEISTGNITVHTGSGDPFKIGSAVSHAVNNSLATFANTGLSG